MSDIRHEIEISTDADNEWINAVMLLLDKLDVKYDKQYFSNIQLGQDKGSLVVEYDDPVVDIILRDLDKRRYIRSELHYDDDEMAMQELSKFTGKSGKELEDWIDYVYDCMPTLSKKPDLSKACNVRLEWDRAEKFCGFKEDLRKDFMQSLKR